MEEEEDHAHARPRKGGFADCVQQVTLTPDCNLSIQELVAVARGDGKGRYGELSLTGDWRERCLQSRTHIEQALNQARQYLVEGKPKEQILEEQAEKRRGTSQPEENDDALLQEIDAVYADLVKQHNEPPITGKLALLIYGVTTGFGSNKDKPLVNLEEIDQLQRNILLSHAAGVGRLLPTEVVRAMMLLRIRTFIEGRSGVRPEIVELLVKMLNHRVHPMVPEQGSVGASGDLCPLAHVGLTLIGEGYAWVGNPPEQIAYTPTDASRKNWQFQLDQRANPLPADEALHQAGLEPLKDLKAKEGLALTNGAVLSAALTALAVYDADILVGIANLCSALTLQAMLGFTRAFDVKVQRARRSWAQEEIAKQVIAFASGSKMLNRAREVQDPYSLRCVPQVHGAALTAIEHVWEIISNEINAVTDNPLFFAEANEHRDLSYPEDQLVCLWDAYSSGNFHGEPVALAADYLKIAVAELASISERRTQLLLDSKHNRGLLENLPTKKPGLNNGLMLAQYTAASLVSENKVLSHPASVDSIPTSANSEDHVSMSPIAARHARQVVCNTRNVLAIELITALQALDLHCHQTKHLEDFKKTSTYKNHPYRFSVTGDLDELLSRAGQAVHAFLREEKGLERVDNDRQLWDLIAIACNSIAKGEVLAKALGGK